MKSILVIGAISICCASLFTVGKSGFSVGSKSQFYLNDRMYMINACAQNSKSFFVKKEVVSVLNIRPELTSLDGSDLFRSLGEKIRENFEVKIDFEPISIENASGNRLLGSQKSLNRFEYSQLLTDAAKSSGVQCRVIYLLRDFDKLDNLRSKHEFIEYYDLSEEKWVLYDPIFELSAEGDGKLLSTSELNEMFVSGESSVTLLGKNQIRTEEYRQQFLRDASAIGSGVFYGPHSSRPMTMILLPLEKMLQVRATQNSHGFVLSNAYQFNLPPS